MSPNHKDIYVEAFSTLRMGLPIYEPSTIVQLGDIGFVDENDGLFHKLYNVAEPPADIDGCPPAVDLVKCEPIEQILKPLHLKLHSKKGASSCVKIPITSTGNTLEQEYKFAEVHGRESILIPGTSIIKECLEEQGVLKKYMVKNHGWIAGQYATKHDFKLNQLILVVGTVKTNSWAIVVTSSDENIADLTFTSLVKAKVWGEWSKNFSLARSGPYMKDNNENTTAN